MISSLIRKAKRAPWVLMGQKLTKKPSNSGAFVSDLFIWRCDQNWNTFFELFDVAGLFGDDIIHHVNIVFFDDSGNKFFQQTLELNGLVRQVISISSLLLALDNVPSSYGTFAVFHQKIPDEISELGSFISERGYVSYQYKDAPLRSYMHGNVDAIDDTMTNLGGTGLFSRRFNLQYVLEANKDYEIVLVNPSSSKKKTEFIVMSFDNKIQFQENIILKSRQALALPIKRLPNDGRLVIKSKIIMARPVVFTFNNHRVDVFHG